MQKKFKGILIYIKINKENDLYIKFLSDTDEIISGIVYGGLSKKKRNIYQIGFFINFNVNFINNRPNVISGELVDPYISTIMNDKFKINCVLSSISLINLSIIEGQKINNIFKLYEEFINILINKNKWIVYYCYFLFNLLKLIGYEIDYKNKKNKSYYDIHKLEFCEKSNSNSIIFPFKLFNIENKNIDYSLIPNTFIIFESVFIKNHLLNINLHLPNQYILFKKLILDFLNKNE